MARNKVGLPPLKIGLLASEEQRNRLIRERVDEEFLRMSALAEKMDIPNGPGRWYAVALSLARLHIPELRPIKHDGRATVWGDFELGVLVVEMEREIASTTPRKSIADAARSLARRSPWKDLLAPWQEGQTHSSDPGEAIRKQYNNGKKNRFAQVARDSFKYSVAMNTPEYWQEMVNMVLEKT
jgi:ribosomal protein RSM22 (predicted rRNA methylase)